MPSTYTAQNAVDLVRKFIKDVPLSGSSVDILLCDSVNSLIHTAYPWRWTLANLTPIALVDETQDYALAAAQVYTAAGGFYRLITARLNRTDTTPDEARELDVVEYLSPELARKGGIHTITQICWLQQDAKLRLEAAAGIAAGVTINIEGIFQVHPTKISALSATFAFPDQYFPVFVAGLKWAALDYVDDPRAGSVALVRGIRQYTGQLGVFHDMLLAMKEAEDFGSGRPLIFPGTPLGTYQTGNPGLLIG